VIAGGLQPTEGSVHLEGRMGHAPWLRAARSTRLGGPSSVRLSSTDRLTVAENVTLAVRGRLSGGDLKSLP